MENQPKQELIARIFIDSNNAHSFRSQFANVGFNFSVIEKGSANQSDDPNFLTSLDAVNQKMEEYSNIALTSSVEKGSDHSDKPVRFLGYDLEMNGSSRSLAFHKIERFVKTVKPVIRRAEKIASDEGINISSFAGYSMAILKSLKVKSITFEDYSEKQGVTRWKTYPLMDLPELLEKAKAMAVEL